MVAVGETLRVPLAATVPIELMLTASAFCTLHCKVELCPAAMLAGFAVKLEITGSAAPTVTVMLQSAPIPPPPVADTVYVVVCVGLTVTVPLLATDPTPGEILTESALTLVQLKVDDWPALMFAGVAEHPNNAGTVEVITVTATDEVSSFTLLRAVRV